MNKKVVGIAGLSGSGKSTLSARLTERLDYTLVPIGEVMREAAKREGYPGLTAYAEGKGTKALFADFRKDVLDAIEAASTKGVVADGVYEYELFEALRARYNGNLIVVGVLLDAEERARRIGIRSMELLRNEGTALAELNRRDRFKIDVGMEAVLRKADITIGNDEAHLVPDRVTQICLERMIPLLRTR